MHGATRPTNTLPPITRRRAIAWTAAAALLPLLPQQVTAQLDPGAPIPIAGDGAGLYNAAAPIQLRAAFARAMAELDIFPARPSPEQVRTTPFRRRLLELRLLTDFNAFAYRPSLMDRFRDAIDDAYEAIGQYQDIAVYRRLTLENVPDVFERERIAHMVVALSALRARELRDEADFFFANPSLGMEPLTPGQVPRVWTIAALGPANSTDSAGNVARLGANILRNLRAQGLFITDILDHLQEERFHDVRKAIRSVLVLTDMYSATRDATAEPRPAIAKLVSAYGDVNDRIVAYRIAQAIGGNVGQRIADLQAEFATETAQQQSIIDQGAFEQMIDRLDAVERARRG
jgi:hypothetical protein